MLETFVNSNCDLRVETFCATENRRADHGREFRVNQGLPADNYERAELFRVIAWFMDSIELPSSHRKCTSEMCITGRDPDTAARLPLRRSIGRRLHSESANHGRGSARVFVVPDTVVQHVR